MASGESQGHRFVYHLLLHCPCRKTLCQVVHHNCYASLTSLNVLGSTCVCKNSMNKFGPLYCKHIAALLFALYVLTHHFSDTKFPKGFECTNMKQFNGACKKLRLQVNFFLTWQQLISNLQTPPPKKRQFSSSYNKIYTEPEPPTKKRKVSEGGDPLLAKKGMS